MDRQERQVGEAALRYYGKIPNAIKAVEELAELQQALCKWMVSPGDKLVLESVYEEIADVGIMLGRLGMMFEWDEIEAYRALKIEKMAEQMGLEDKNERTGDKTQLCGAPAGDPADQRLGEQVDRLRELRV